MKNKAILSQEMQKNLSSSQDHFISGLEKLSLAASLAEQLELTSVTEMLTIITEKSVYKQN